MKKIKQMVTLCGIIIVSYNLNAQKNPGYLGKKNVFSLSNSAFPYAFVQNFNLLPSIGIGYERSLYRNMSVELGYVRYSIAIHSADFMIVGNRGLKYK